FRQLLQMVRLVEFDARRLREETVAQDVSADPVVDPARLARQVIGQSEEPGVFRGAEICRNILPPLGRERIRRLMKNDVRYLRDLRDPCRYLVLLRLPLHEVADSDTKPRLDPLRAQAKQDVPRIAPPAERH